LNHRADAAQSQERTKRLHSKPLVDVAVASYHDIEQTFEAVGNVDSPMSVKIAPRYAGPVASIAVSEGQHVTAGQVLAAIDPSEARATVSQDLANVAQAKQRLAQAQLTQNSTDVGVLSTIRQAQAGVDGATNAYRDAQRNYVNNVAAAKAAVTDAEGKVASATAQVANAKAELESAKANQDNAQAKNAREASLYKQGFIAAQDYDDSKAALGVANANVDVATAQVNSAQSAEGSAKAELQSAKDQLSAVEVTATGSVTSARTQVVDARATLKTAVANKSQQSAYVANLAALQAAVVASEAQLHDAQVQLQYTVLRSPIDGFVTARLMDPGAQATAGQEILEVQQLKQVWVTVAVPEEETAGMHMGQDATVSFDALRGKTYRGKVTQINASADPSNRQFSVRVAIDNPKNEIHPGMFARVDFVTGLLPHQVYVPREAVTTETSGVSTVMEVDQDGKAHQNIVKVGASDAGGYAIAAGVQPGDKLITFSAIPVKDGQAVRISGAGGSEGGHHHHSHQDS
jgi:RND family efflux transporter MFP subunit